MLAQRILAVYKSRQCIYEFLDDYIIDILMQPQSIDSGTMPAARAGPLVNKSTYPQLRFILKSMWVTVYG